MATRIHSSQRDDQSAQADFRNPGFYPGFFVVLRKPRDSRVVPLSLSGVFSFNTPNVYNQKRDLPVTQKNTH